MSELITPEIGAKTCADQCEATAYQIELRKADGIIQSLRDQLAAKEAELNRWRHQHNQIGTKKQIKELQSENATLRARVEGLLEILRHIEIIHRTNNSERSKATRAYCKKALKQEQSG